MSAVRGAEIWSEAVGGVVTREELEDEAVEGYAEDVLK
jgi:hypothetical protein